MQAPFVTEEGLLDGSETQSDSEGSDESRFLESAPSHRDLLQGVYVSRKDRTAQSAGRPRSSRSDDSDNPAEVGGAKDWIERIEQAIAEGSAREAAHMSVEAIRTHPRNTSLQRLSVETSNLVKWYPRFYDALVRVTLAEPTVPAVIGNLLSVGFKYSHKKPTTAFKDFLPLARFVDKQVSRYNEQMMRNSKLSSERVQSIVAKSLNVEKSDISSISSMHATQESRERAKNEWSDQELEILRSTVEAGKKDRLSDLVESAKERIFADLQIERQPWELREIIKSIRLYKDVQMLDHVQLSDSDKAHHSEDWIGLFKSQPRQVEEQDPVAVFSRLSSVPSQAARLESSGGASSADAEEEDDDEEEDSTVKGRLMKLSVPDGNEGEIDFSEAVLPIGHFEFRYYMKGSSTPACVSAPFETVMPDASLSVPQQPVLCGDPFAVGFAIELNREHSAKDWIEIVQLDGYGPLGSAMHVAVPEGNVGEVILERSPIFPGTYHAQYHFGHHGGMVAATSACFEVAIRERSERDKTREVRVFLCSTVADMFRERAAVLQRVVPALQARLESRFLTVSIVPMSMGVTEDGGNTTEEETASLEHLRVSLREVERCRPFFVAVLGERYGWIPDRYDQDMVSTYPWLDASRNANMLLAGVRISGVEIQVLNGFLIQPAMARHHAFFLREADYVRRSDVPLRSRGKYEPLSEFGREAVNQLKDEIRKVPEAKLTTFHSEEALTTGMIDHLSAAIDTEYPQSREVTPLERIALVTDRLYANMLDSMLEHHPSMDNVPLAAEVVFSSHVPVFLQAPAGFGKSSIIAAAFRRFLEELHADSTVQWDGKPRMLGDGASATSFSRGGVKHALLVEHIGTDSTVTTEAEVLHHAMTFTKAAFGLRLNVPWDHEELIDLVPSWLEQVSARGVFIWVLDGVDQFMGQCPIEGVVRLQTASPDKSLAAGGKTTTQLTQQRKDVQEAVEAQEQREREKLHGARQQAQHSLRRWLLPLLDQNSSHYAPTAFPNLRVLVSAETPSTDFLRPVDTHLHTLLLHTLGSLRVMEIPTWLVDQRKRFVRARVEQAVATGTEQVPTEAADFLLVEVKPVTAAAGDAAGATAAQQQEPPAKDLFDCALHSQLVVAGVLEACRTLPADERKARFKALRACSSLDKLCLKLVRLKAEESPGAADFLRFIFLSRTGLRESELLLLLRKRQWISGEDLILLVEHSEMLASKVFGKIALREPFKKAAASLFSSLELRAEMMEELADLFGAMHNPQRKAEELPLLLLRLGRTEALLHYLCTQEALSLIGKRDLLRYVKAAGFPHEAVALGLKRQLEVAFGVEAIAGRRYDIGKLHALEPLGAVGRGAPDDMDGVEADMLPSVQRAVMVATRVRFFCQRVTDVVDVMCHMDATAMEVAEGLLESVLKMLFAADALAASAERETAYPSDALRIMAAMVTLFAGGLRAMSAEDLAQTARQESVRQYHMGAVAELMLGKVQILAQAVAGIQQKASSEVLWESQAVEGSIIRLQRKLTGTGDDEAAPKRRSALQRKKSGLLNLS